MKTKIYQNREGLQGKKVIVRLCGRSYEFKIMYVTRKEITVYTTFKFRELGYAGSDSVESIIKNIISENTPDNKLSLSRKASLASGKLKRIAVVIEGNKFKFDQITNSGLRLVKSITYDELFGCEKPSFTYDVLNFVKNNISDNPPKPRKVVNRYSWDVPYLFDSGGNTMNFKTLGHRRTVVSESKLEINRQKHKQLLKEEKEKREKMEKLEKDLNLNKKSKTRDLARYR